LLGFFTLGPSRLFFAIFAVESFPRRACDD